MSIRYFNPGHKLDKYFRPELIYSGIPELKPSMQSHKEILLDHSKMHVYLYCIWQFDNVKGSRKYFYSVCIFIESSRMTVKIN